MYVLGALVVWAPLLAIAGAIVATAMRIVWQVWQRVQRARRAAWWAAQQPYDRAQVRMAETIAWERGGQDMRAELEGL